MLRHIEWGVKNGPITKSGGFPLTTLFSFGKFNFNLELPIKKHIHTFRKRWSFICGCVFPVSIQRRIQG